MSRERAAVIEAAIVELVAALPDLPSDRLRGLAAEAGALAEGAAAPTAALARALAAALARYADGAAPLEGWGLVAAAADTLGRALGGDPTATATALAAARFELDSLAAPAAARPPSAASPDVPATSLRRRT